MKIKDIALKMLLAIDNSILKLLLSFVLLLAFFVFGYILFVLYLPKDSSASISDYFHFFIAIDYKDSHSLIVIFYVLFIRVIVLALLINVLSDIYKKYAFYLNDIKNLYLIRRAFHRRKDSETGCYVVPRYLSFSHLKAILQLSEEDIIHAISRCDNIRIRNITVQRTNHEHFHDFLVLETYPINTKYGCFVDRKSNITIVAPTCPSEACFSSFAFNVAKFGGFNYISKEIERHREFKTSYYNIEESSADTNRDLFISELKKLATQDNYNSWVIVLLGASTMKREACHLQYKYHSGKSTILDMDRFNQFKDKLKIEFQNLSNQHVSLPLDVSDCAYNPLIENKYLGQIL